jgi:hypothetical protein
MDLLLGNACKTNETTAAAWQQTMCNSESTTPRLYELTEFSSVSQCSAVEYSGVKWVGEQSVSQSVSQSVIKKSPRICPSK